MAAAAARRRSILFLSLATTKNQYFPKSSSIIGVRTATTSIFSSILANSRPFHHSSSIVTQDLRYTCRNCGSSRSTTTTGNFDWNPQRVTNFDSIVEEATDPVNFGRGDEKHWLIGYFFDGVDFASEQELFDFYVDTLALCFPTKEEARKRIYLVSCEHTFGFGAESDFPYLRGCPNISFVMEDACYGDRNKDLTGQPVVHFTPLNYNHRLNDIYSYYHMSKFNSEWNDDHWIVHLKHPECKLVGLNVVDYCVRLLATIVGSEDDARKKVYVVWSVVPFGFGAEIDKKTLTKLKDLEDVLVVLPDYSFDAKHKGGLVLYVERPDHGKLYSKCRYLSDDKCIYWGEESDDEEEPVSESVYRNHPFDLAWTWKKDPRKYF